jgi:hypothetical protein
MRLLQYNDGGDFSLKGFFESVPKYAILSHRWEAEEVTFQDLLDGTCTDKAGYEKIRFCGEQASRDGLKYFWVDTCCIDKSNNTELSEAINSMFRWYQNAVKCYVYLSDVSIKECSSSSDLLGELAFKSSRWFTRGWTLQELLAPSHVEFFSVGGIRLGDKSSLGSQIHEITRIPIDALQGRSPLTYSSMERFKWAERRRTTREEDKAYSLMGLFGIYMPLIYGEGFQNALSRLLRETNVRSSHLPNGE